MHLLAGQQVGEQIQGEKHLCSRHKQSCVSAAEPSVTQVACQIFLQKEFIY